MNTLLFNIIPLLLLILFGCALRRASYFSDADIQKITGFIGDFLVPCVIFNTILHLELRGEHAALSIAFFLFLCLLLLISRLFFRILRIKRRFFIFFHSAFAFGLMGIPLFSAVFGEEHMEYLVALGVGHELYIALVYITAMKITLQEEPFRIRSLPHSLSSPLFYMVTAALVLNLTGWRDFAASTVLGGCLFETIARLASITTALTMIVVGYQIRFQNTKRLKESAGYVVFRYAMTFAFGYLYKFLVLDQLSAPSPYFNYAYFTLLSQFGSTLLVMLVGKYCSQEDMEVASYAFVLNVVAGIFLYVAFVACLGSLP